MAVQISTTEHIVKPCETGQSEQKKAATSMSTLDVIQPR